MKKLIVIILGAFLCSTAQAQIKNIPVTSDSSVTLDAIYAGILAWNSFSVDSVYATKSATLRAGGSATWKLSSTLTLNSFGVIETDPKSSFVISQFHLRFTPSSKWKFAIGNLPTLSTEMRPLPYVGAGQFETSTEARIPGIAPGFKMKFIPTDKLSFGVGVATRAHEPEYHAKVTSGKLTLSGWQAADKRHGVAFNYDGPKVYTTTVFIERKVLANLFVFNFGKKMAIYSDTGYDLTSDKLIRGEWGLIKKFEGTLFSGLIGLGYAKEKRLVNAYLFLHL